MSRARKMGVAEILLRKHTAIAKVLVPCSVGYGFMYTIQNNSNPLVDAKNSVLGTLAEANVPADSV